MKYPLVLLVLLNLLIAPLTFAQAQSEDDEQNRRIYLFEHRLIPTWVYTSDGAFFNAFLRGEIDQLKRVATEIAGKEFADQLTVKTIVPDEAVLITFAPPVKSPQCYAGIVAKKGNGFIYYTLEKALDLDGNGQVKAMYCAWTAEKIRENYGARNYDTVDAFVKEFLTEAPTQVQAGLRLAD